MPALYSLVWYGLHLVFYDAITLAGHVFNTKSDILNKVFRSPSFDKKCGKTAVCFTFTGLLF